MFPVTSKLTVGWIDRLSCYGEESAGRTERGMRQNLTRVPVERHVVMPKIVLKNHEDVWPWGRKWRWGWGRWGVRVRGQW